MPGNKNSALEEANAELFLAKGLPDEVTDISNNTVSIDPSDFVAVTPALYQRKTAVIERCFASDESGKKLKKLLLMPAESGDAASLKLAVFYEDVPLSGSKKLELLTITAKALIDSRDFTYLEAFYPEFLSLINGSMGRENSFSSWVTEFKTTNLSIYFTSHDHQVPLSVCEGAQQLFDSVSSSSSEESVEANAFQYYWKLLQLRAGWEKSNPSMRSFFSGSDASIIPVSEEMSFAGKLKKLINDFDKACTPLSGEDASDEKQSLFSLERDLLGQLAEYAARSSKNKARSQVIVNLLVGMPLKAGRVDVLAELLRYKAQGVILSFQGKDIISEYLPQYVASLKNSEDAEQYSSELAFLGKINVYQAATSRSTWWWQRRSAKRRLRELQLSLSDSFLGKDDEFNDRLVKLGQSVKGKPAALRRLIVDGLIGARNPVAPSLSIAAPQLHKALSIYQTAVKARKFSFFRPATWVKQATSSMRASQLKQLNGLLLDNAKSSIDVFKALITLQTEIKAEVASSKVKRGSMLLSIVGQAIAHYQRVEFADRVIADMRKGDAPIFVSDVLSSDDDILSFKLLFGDRSASVAKEIILFYKNSLISAHINSTPLPGSGATTLRSRGSAQSALSRSSAKRKKFKILDLKKESVLKRLALLVSKESFGQENANVQSQLKDLHSTYNAYYFISELLHHGDFKRLSFLNDDVSRQDGVTMRQVFGAKGVDKVLEAIAKVIEARVSAADSDFFRVSPEKLSGKSFHPGAVLFSVIGKLLEVSVGTPSENQATGFTLLRIDKMKQNLKGLYGRYRALAATRVMKGEIASDLLCLPEGQVSGSLADWFGLEGANQVVTQLEEIKTDQQKCFLVSKLLASFSDGKLNSLKSQNDSLKKKVTFSRLLKALNLEGKSSSSVTSIAQAPGSGDSLAEGLEWITFIEKGGDDAPAKINLSSILEATDETALLKKITEAFDLALKLNVDAIAKRDMHAYERIDRLLMLVEGSPSSGDAYKPLYAKSTALREKTNYASLLVELGLVQGEMTGRRLSLGSVGSSDSADSLQVGSVSNKPKLDLLVLIGEVNAKDLLIRLGTSVESALGPTPTGVSLTQQQKARNVIAKADVALKFLAFCQKSWSQTEDVKALEKQLGIYKNANMSALAKSKLQAKKRYQHCCADSMKFLTENAAKQAAVVLGPDVLATKNGDAVTWQGVVKSFSGASTDQLAEFMLPYLLLTWEHAKRTALEPHLKAGAYPSFMESYESLSDQGEPAVSSKAFTSAGRNVAYQFLKALNLSGDSKAASVMTKLNGLMPLIEACASAKKACAKATAQNIEALAQNELKVNFNLCDEIVEVLNCFITSSSQDASSLSDCLIEAKKALQNIAGSFHDLFDSSSDFSESACRAHLVELNAACLKLINDGLHLSSSLSNPTATSSLVSG